MNETKTVATHDPAAASAAIPFSHVQRMAEAIAKSGLFGMKTVDQALALMAIAQAEGRHPATVARDFDIIGGRPFKRAEAMVRDFLVSGGKITWHRLDDELASATFSHPVGGTVKIDWDMERAQKAGLAGKEMYTKYRRAMLRSRCVSEGCRTVFPIATSGFWTPEEASLMNPVAERADVVRPSINDDPVVIVEPERDMQPASDTTEHAAPTARKQLTSEEVTTYMGRIVDAKSENELRDAYVAACVHANDLKDRDAKDRFIAAYNDRKQQLNDESWRVPEK